MIRTNSECFFRDAKRPVRFPLEDKHVVNEHRAVRKSHDATQEKCPHVVHFNVPRKWFETISWHQKRQKNSWVSWCTGSSNTVNPLLNPSQIYPPPPSL